MHKPYKGTLLSCILRCIERIANRKWCTTTGYPANTMPSSGRKGDHEVVEGARVTSKQGHISGSRILPHPTSSGGAVAFAMRQPDENTSVFIEEL